MARSDFDHNVFINCPFDDAYKPIFDAITFTVHAAGFTARTALEENDAASERHAKLTQLIGECKFGIHDLSRVEIDSDSKLPRLNMAYECGLFYGALLFGNRVQKGKQILVLDSAPFRYRATISDIAGKDVTHHNNDPGNAIDCVRRFLNNKGGNGRLPGKSRLLKYYQCFCDDLPSIAEDLGCSLSDLRGLPYWPDFAAAVVEWLRIHPLA